MLGVPKGATREEVHAAFRAKSKRYHPDTGGEDWTFIQLKEAYEQILRDLDEPVEDAPDQAQEEGSTSDGESKFHSVIFLICVSFMIGFLIYKYGWLLPLVTATLWLVLVIALVSGVVTLVCANFWPAYLEQLGAYRWGRIAGALLATATLCAVVLHWIPSGVPTPEPFTRGSGLPKDLLGQATATVRGTWEEEDVLANDQYTWTGTTFVVGKREQNLVLCTNSHCLALEELARGDSDTDNTVEILSYSLTVKFASGNIRPALRMAVDSDGLDIGFLELAASGLIPGYDYVVVPHTAGIVPRPGDPVIAVGNPLGELPDTRTFGRISAVRQLPWGSKSLRILQHGAATNPGNSGGPLFLEKGGKVLWIGINTWSLSVAQGINLSIAADEAVNAKMQWASANPAGAAELIRQIHGVSATSSPRSR